MRRRVQKNKKGFTLVELVVSFALTGLLLASAAVVLTNYGQVTADMTMIAQSELTAANLMDAIRAELAYAANNKNWYNREETEVKDYVEEFKSRNSGPEHSSLVEKEVSMLIADLKEGSDQEGRSISFANRYDTLVKICKNNKGRLCIRYGYPGGEDPSTGGSGGPKVVEWDFGDQVYMSNTIEELTFEHKGDSVIKVYLKLKNNKNGYVTEKTSYMECFNVPSERIITWVQTDESE